MGSKRLSLSKADILHWLWIVVEVAIAAILTWITTKLPDLNLGAFESFKTPLITLLLDLARRFAADTTQSITTTSSASITSTVTTQPEDKATLQ
jgi:hypothetical protein